MFRGFWWNTPTDAGAGSSPITRRKPYIAVAASTWGIPLQ